MAGSAVLRDVPSRDDAAMRQIVLASVLGTVVEWYDFLV
jgi:hypothetical protein